MPLKIIVVGAGLAGLGAAIALNRVGHDVEVIEQSGFLNEVGAAIHVAPNATRILKEWGCDFDTLQPVQCNRLLVWDEMGVRVKTQLVAKDLQEALNITDEWLLTHRVDLHNTLRAAAAKEVNGKRSSIRLSSRVASVDAEAGEVLLEDGTKYTGDLIIGADGIHSRCVRQVTGGDPQRENTGQNCFRFLVPVSKMMANSLTGSLLQKTGVDGLHAFSSDDRRLVIYPCRHGTLLNVAAIHPSSDSLEENAAKNSSWLNQGNVDHLLETYKDFAPALLEMCKMAEDLKLWSLGSRRPPYSFYEDKLVLVGDAAHPTLPHQGQGGAQAFEDGAALGALFPPDTTKGQVSQRLKLYNQVRYERAVTMMMMSRINDERRAEMLDELRRYVPDAKVPENMFSFAWGSYPGREAGCLLEAA